MTVEAFDTVGSHTWTCPAGLTKIDVAVVGGAGGGGTGAQYVGGGGGAATANTNSGTKVTVVPGTEYTIYVGDGGEGAATGLVNGSSGNASTLYIGVAPYITSAGGVGGNRGADNNTGYEAGTNGPGGETYGGTGVDGGHGHYGGDCSGGTTGGAGGTGAGGGGGGGGNLSWGCAVGLGGKGGHGYVTITYTAASAAFSGTPLTGDKPLTVAFTGPASQDTYAWDFGDSETASTQSPSHEYHFAGKKTVILATTNAYGFAVETKVDYVTALFKARMHGIACMSDGLRGT